MSDQNQPESMTGVLDQTIEETEGDEVSLGEILDSFGHRSYGPLFLFISLIALTPIIGGIPPMSIITSILIMVLAAQLLFLLPHPWMPKKLLAFSFSRDKLTKGVDKARPWAKWFGKAVKERLTFFAEPPFVNVIALLCIVLAASFFPLAVIPFGVMVPAAAIFLFGLGLTARDGVVISIGLLIAAVSAWLTIAYWPDSWSPF